MFFGGSDTLWRARADGTNKIKLKFKFDFGTRIDILRV
jgi:hypothetical protein